MKKKYTAAEAGRKGGLATAKRHPNHHRNAAKKMWAKIKPKTMSDTKHINDEGQDTQG